MKTNYMARLTANQMQYLDEKSKDLGISRGELTRRILDDRISTDKEKRGPGRPPKEKEVQAPEAPEPWVELPMTNLEDWMPKTYLGHRVRERGTIKAAIWDPLEGMYQAIEMKR